MLTSFAQAAFATSDNSHALEPVHEQLRLKNFSHAAELLEPLATNNTQAALLLANLYRQGLGVNVDATRTRHWLTLAAQQGNAQAMYELAALLADDRPADEGLIQQWLQRATKAGDARAAEALRERVTPLQFQPALLGDAQARQTAFWLAAAQDDITQLGAFNDAALPHNADEFGRAALSYAARHGAAHASEWLLRAGANPHQADSFGMTPLMLAANSGQPAVVTQLLKSGASANAQDRLGNNALMYAIFRQRTDCINALLPVTDIKQRNAQGWSVLDWAMRSNDNTLIARLRSLGAQSSAKTQVASDKPVMPLQHAASGDLYGNWPDILIASTRDGTKLFDAVILSNNNALRSNESASLLIAVQSNNIALIDRLLAGGVPAGMNGNETPLSWAVRHGKPRLVQKLLAAGVKPDTHGNNESAPLLDVARMQDAAALETMDALLKAGASPDTRDRPGRTALMISIQAQQPLLVERLLQSGANSELSDNSGRSALMLAAQSGNTTIIRLLLTHQAAIDKRDNDGNSALMLAAAKGHADAVAVLMTAGASTQGNKLGVSALMLAAAAGQDAIIKKLLSAGVKADAQDLHGDTALIHATRKGQLAAARALLAAGADAGLRNNDRASALDVAERLALRDVAAALTRRD